VGRCTFSQKVSEHATTAIGERPQSPASMRTHGNAHRSGCPTWLTLNAATRGVVRQSNGGCVSYVGPACAQDARRAMSAALVYLASVAHSFWNCVAGMQRAVGDVRSPRSAIAFEAEGTPWQPCTESGSCCARGWGEVRRGGTGVSGGRGGGAPQSRCSA